MRTQITSAIAMLITVASMITSAQAQVSTLPTAVQPQAQAYVGPGYPTVQPPQPQNQFYFGVNVQLKRGYQGTTLRITSVTPGSPAQAAGLEIGDEIRTINGHGFERARDSFHAVSLMNRFVSYNNPSAPAAAAQAYVTPLPTPRPSAQMLVRNVRNGQNVWVNVYPQRRGWNGPTAPAAATIASSNPAYTVPAPTTAVPVTPGYSTPSY